MPEPRILGLVSSCGKCPNRTYYSMNVYRCTKVDQPILDDSRVAPFCPLPLFPARDIASMEKTIRTSQEGLAEQPFGTYLLQYIAAQLKTEIHPEGSSLDIKLKDGNTVRLDLHHARLMEDVFRLSIAFGGEAVGESYRLTLGKPILLEYGSFGGEGVMQHVQLAHR